MKRRKRRKRICCHYIKPQQKIGSSFDIFNGFDQVRSSKVNPWIKRKVGQTPVLNYSLLNSKNEMMILADEVWKNVGFKTQV